MPIQAPVVHRMPDGLRFVSRLTRSALALILASSRGSRLKQFAE